MSNVLADALIRLEIEEHMRKKDEYNARLAAFMQALKKKEDSTANEYNGTKQTMRTLPRKLPDGTVVQEQVNEKPMVP